MKYAFLLCYTVASLLLFPFSLLAQVRTIQNPLVSKTNSEHLVVQSIELRPDATQVGFEFSCFEGLAYTLHQPNSYQAFKIIYQGRTYALKGAADKESPFGTIKCDMMSVRYFTLIFEPLPLDADIISLQEGERYDDEIFFEKVVLSSLEEVRSKAMAGSLPYLRLLGEHYEREYDYEKAQEYYQRYTDGIIKSEGLNSPAHLEGINLMIQLNLKLGNYTEAEELALQTIEAAGEGVAAASITATLGDVYQILGRHREAVDTYLKYMKMVENDEQLRTTNQSTVFNLIMYSYSQLEEQDSSIPPLAIGSSVSAKKSDNKVAEIRLYAAGATEVQISNSAEMQADKWEVYDVLSTFERPLDGRELYVQFRTKRDEKEYYSEKIKVKL
jgi:tetratricopeptide (TPR) repeat protein